MRKVCVVTGSRAEYGLLRWVMDGISKSDELDLQVCVTGMHLSPEFGSTYLEIEKDGFSIDAKVDSLLSVDSSAGITKSVGLGAIGFSDCLERLKPDLLVVLGDRFEILPAVFAALFARIPVAHIHGGETTEGAFDESIRHSITKMSHLHFVAAEEYRNRVIQLGEQPEKVFCVGGLGIDNILKLNLLSKLELEKSLDIQMNKTNLLVTFHPVTLEDEPSETQMNELFDALDELVNCLIVFTMPNADTDGKSLMEMINKFAQERSNVEAFTSLGQLRYLSCIKHFDVVVGNSSSGLAEVPTFRKPTINIGTRQDGRLRADSVIDCKLKKCAILKAIERSLSEDFQSKLEKVRNPYGNGGASNKIVESITSTDLNSILKKKFYNLPKFSDLP